MLFCVDLSNHIGITSTSYVLCGSDSKRSMLESVCLLSAAMHTEDVEPAAAGATAEVAPPPADAPAPAAEPTAPTAEATAPTAEPTAPSATTAGAAAQAEVPVSEAVKHIGGTKAGESKVSEQPTAKKAIDSIPVGPGPATATAAGASSAQPDSNQDGDYYLDAALADSNLPDMDAPADQVNDQCYAAVYWAQVSAQDVLRA